MFFCCILLTLCFISDFVYCILITCISVTCDWFAFALVLLVYVVVAVIGVLCWRDFVGGLIYVRWVYICLLVYVLFGLLVLLCLCLAMLFTSVRWMLGLLLLDYLVLDSGFAWDWFWLWCLCWVCGTGFEKGSCDCNCACVVFVGLLFGFTDCVCGNLIVFR